MLMMLSYGCAPQIWLDLGPGADYTEGGCEDDEHKHDEGRLSHATGALFEYDETSSWLAAKEVPLLS